MRMRRISNSTKLEFNRKKIKSGDEKQIKKVIARIKKEYDTKILHRI